MAALHRAHDGEEQRVQAVHARALTQQVIGQNNTSVTVHCNDLILVFSVFYLTCTLKQSQTHPDFKKKVTSMSMERENKRPLYLFKVVSSTDSTLRAARSPASN